MATLSQRRLAKHLSSLRLQSGKTKSDVEQALIVSRKTLTRIEKAETTTSWPIVEALCGLYGASPELTVRLKQIALQCKQKGMSEQATASAPSGFSLLPELEAEAATIDIYECEVLPGWIQPRTYAQRLLEASPLVPTVEIPEIISHRESRRPRITAEVRILLPEHVVPSEAVDDLRCYDTRVIPSGVLTAATLGSFYLMTFDDPLDPAVVYTEGVSGSRYDEGEAIVNRYTAVFEAAWQEGKTL